MTNNLRVAGISSLRFIWAVPPVRSAMLGQATAALDQGHLLSQMRGGTRARIGRLLAAPEVCQRLREMGLGERQVLRLVVRSANIICQVCNSRLALSRELAAQILVEPVGTLSL